MDYEGLTMDDLANVAALNRAWLDSGNRQAGDERLPPAHIERLAAVPFLLFSFREHDDRLWRRLLRDEPQADLIEDAPFDDANLRSLQVAGLAFLWDLVRRNPYVARIVSGATLEWCDRLARSTAAGLLCRAGHRRIICERFAADDVRLDRLRGCGASFDEALREATQMSVLQSLLTQSRDARYSPLPAVARSLNSPHRKVAD
ncbi:MAG: hypothetical protein QNJ11_04700 [Woeseiaceae bacterium]|nr:hypothetical protein [Woeseiaceae bacterium]